MPEGKLASLAVGGSANVHIAVRPSSHFAVSAFGQGWVTYAPSVLDDTYVRVMNSGQSAVALCPQQASTAFALEVHNSGGGSVVSERLRATHVSAELSGTGPVALLADAASGSDAHVALSGSSTLQAR